MQNTSITLSAEIGYDSLAIQDKIVLPIEAGKWTMLKYQQHPAEPLSIEKVSLQRVNHDRLQFRIRLTGKLKIKLLPDLKLVGTELFVESKVRIEENDLVLDDVKVVKIESGKKPKIIAKLFQKHLNKKLSGHFERLMNQHIQKLFTGIRDIMRTANQFEIKFDSKTYPYEFQLNGRQRTMDVELTPASIRIQTGFDFGMRILEC